MTPLTAQFRAELTMIFTNGETLFLTLGIPVVFLIFFSGVHVLPTGTEHPVDFLVPGILALAVMSTAMTALGIGTGFERGYGVLKRLGATPLGRPRLMAAKIMAITAVELIQAAVLVSVGLGLGWNPGGPAGAGALVGAAIGAMVLGTVAFGGIGLFLAGRLKPLVNLAAVNGLFVILLLLGGMLIPLGKLPGWLAGIARVLPAVGPGRCVARHPRAWHAGHRRRLDRAGRLGSGGAGRGRAHLLVGVTGAVPVAGHRIGRDAAASRLQHPPDCSDAGRAAHMPDDLAAGADEEGLGIAVDPIETGAHLAVVGRPPDT